MKEPMFKNCCCCVNLKIGCCIYVGLILLGSIFDIFKKISEFFATTDDSQYVLSQKEGDVDLYSYAGKSEFKVF